jgi:hypothetical protein
MKHGEGVIGSEAEGRGPKGVPRIDPRVFDSSPVRPVHHNGSTEYLIKRCQDSL